VQATFKPRILRGLGVTARKALIVGLLLLSGGPALSQPGDEPGLTNGVHAGLRGSYSFSGNHVTTYAPP
jgi:hypothetical protein